MPGNIMTHNRTILLLAAACGFALSAAACSASYGDDCSFPQAFVLQNTCPDGELSSGTCIYNNSAECASGICVAHEQKQAFCSEECTNKSDCKEGSDCLMLSENSDTGYCVPNRN